VLREFGSLRALRAASIAELEVSKALDKPTANHLYDFLHSGFDG